MRRKATELIPLEKSKKVIHLDRRGKKARTIERAEKTASSIGVVLFGALAVTCLIYFFSVILFMGFGTRFFLMWGVLAVVFGTFSVFLAHREWRKRLPGWVKVTSRVVLIAGSLCFVWVEGLVLSGFHYSASQNADYMIVLGAQWKSTGPSYVLQKRLDKALDYLKENPDTCVIVSGGQGSDEVVSEAAGMKEYLIEHGIAEERICMEDRSTSTVENLKFSAEFLDTEKDNIILVTNNFHMFRALKLAQKQGYQQVEGLVAPSYPGMLPNNMLREFCAVTVEFLRGTI